MKLTALSELIQYYKENQGNIAYDVLLHKLVDKITHLQHNEREQIIKAYEQRAIDQAEGYLRTGEQYYNETYL